MAGKEFEARIRLKRDTSANWTANNPVLLNGEMILVDTTSGNVRTKTGNGVKTYTQLPFDDEAIYNALNGKCDASNSVDVTLSASAWTNGQQTVSVSGLKAAQNGIASLPQNFSVAVYEAVVAAQLFVSAQTDGSLTFSCNGDVPQIDIPILVILLG